MATAKLDMDKLDSLCLRRGFIFPSSKIYGGFSGFWDYGPLGVELKKNIKDAWWQDMVRNPPPGPDGQEIAMVGLDCSIIMNPKVWEASGHVGGFSDPMVDCLKCRRRFRADKVIFASADVDQKTLVISVEADNISDGKAKVQEKVSKLQKKRDPRGLLQFASSIGYSTASSVASWGPPRPCPADDCDGSLTEPRGFNLM